MPTQKSFAKLVHHKNVVRYLILENIDSTLSITVKTEDNSKCVFPFKYLGVLHYDCTLWNEPEAWCGLSEDYDEDKNWGWCKTLEVPSECPGK